MGLTMESLGQLAVSIGVDLALPIKSHIIIKKVKSYRIENCSLTLPYLRHATVGGLGRKHQ